MRSSRSRARFWQIRPGRRRKTTGELAKVSRINFGPVTRVIHTESGYDWEEISSMQNLPEIYGDGS